MTENVAVLFYDSKFPTALLDDFKGLERKYSASAGNETIVLKFFLVDKQDTANADIFKLQEFQSLPALYALIMQDHQSESAGQNLTKEKMDFFLAVKTAQVKEEVVERIGSKTDYISAKNKNEYVIFVQNDCKHCNRAFSVLARHAVVKGEKLNIVFCDDMFEICDELKVFQFPTILKGAKQYFVQDVMDLYQPQGVDFEGQKPTGVKRYAQHALRKRIDVLEAKVKLLEEKLAGKKDEL